MPIFGKASLILCEQGVFFRFKPTVLSSGNLSCFNIGKLIMSKRKAVRMASVIFNDNRLQIHTQPHNDTESLPADYFDISAASLKRAFSQEVIN